MRYACPSPKPPKFRLFVAILRVGDSSGGAADMWRARPIMPAITFFLSSYTLGMQMNPCP